MTSKHTPPPWRTAKPGEYPGKDFVVRTALNPRRGHRYATMIASVFEGDLIKNGKDNARLIAAAPVMYDALQQIASGGCCLTPGCSVDNPMCDAMTARAALAQVEGEKEAQP